MIRLSLGAFGYYLQFSSVTSVMVIESPSTDVNI